MKAIQVYECGSPENMKLVEIPIPVPGPGKVLVKLAAIGVNFIDIYFRTGLYEAPLPVSLGMEGAGTVAAVGEGVRGFEPGSRVAYCMERGSYAEFAVVDAKWLVPVPNELDLKLASAVILQGMTAHYLTHSTFPLKKGHTCLVHAAAGGTGRLLVQIAKMRGAKVIGTASTPAKAEIARAAGADDIILYTVNDFEQEVKRLTKNEGVDVVYDAVGAAIFTKSLNSLRPRGMMVSFGNASGTVAPMEPLLLSQKGSLFLTRPNLGHYLLTREELEWRANDIFNWVISGKLKTKIDHVYPLAEAAQAHIALVGRTTSGKLLLEP